MTSLTTATSSSTEEFPPWSPAGPDDVRSPCPALNSMANHGIIPHSGRGLTTALLLDALQNTYNLDPVMARLALYGGTLAPHLLLRRSFNLDDLQRAKMFKHDGLLARPDFHTGKDVNDFSQETWDFVMRRFEGSAETSVTSVANARHDRIAEAIRRNPKTVEYGSICYVLSYGEIAALLAVFADTETGKASVQYLNIWFAEERLPYIEGWRPHKTPVALSQVLKYMARLIRETGEDDTRPALIKLLGIGGGGGGRARTS